MVIWDFASELVADLATRRPDDLILLIFDTLAGADQETFDRALEILREHGLVERLEQASATRLSS